jgi:hypothetical protein
VDNVLQDKWRLICPPKNWRQPVPIDEEELSLLGIISERLSLVLTRDDERKKIYLGTALASDATTANGIRYANGWRADVVLDEDAGAEYKSVDPGAAAPLIRAFPDAQISKSFRLSEFYPKGTQRPGRHTYEYIRLSPSLVNALEEIRERTGRPVTVTSGYRPPAYNREVGGVSNSCHIDGLAADIYCDGLTTDQLYDICEQVIGKRGGVGYYPKSGFIHVDVRGYEARWSGF